MGNLTFQELQAKEREFYLGKLSDEDKLPGSDVTFGEAKQIALESQEKFDQQRAERKARVLAEKSHNTVETTIITPGVTADFVHKNFYPTAEQLESWEIKDLITFGVEHKIDVKANVDSKPALIAKILGNYTPARFEKISEKTSRETLDKYAIELGLVKTAEESKEIFATNSDIAKAIEEARQ